MRFFIPVLRLLCVIAVAGFTAAFKWPELDPQLLAETTPVVDAEAGAEIVRQDVFLKRYSGTVATLEIFVRIKIYNERGVSDNALIEIPFNRRKKIRDLTARTVLPDGTILTLTPKDFFDREIIKAGGLRESVKSFAPAGLIPGAVVEYSYELKQSEYTYPFIVEFQNKQPTRRSEFRFNISDWRDYGMQPQRFNCKGLTENRDERFATFTLHNISASNEEPFGPPAINREPALIFLSRYNHGRWLAEVNQSLFKDITAKTKPHRLVTRTLASIIDEGDTETQKLKKIYEFCSTKLINKTLESTRLTEAQWSQNNKNPADTLKAGFGTADDINDAFAALVRAAGFEVSVALCNDRSFYFLGFDRERTNIPRAPYVFTDRVIAVRNTEKRFLFFDPGYGYLPFGQLSWKNTETALFVAKKDTPEFLFVFPAASTAALRKRRATLQLDAEGTLEGDVTIEYSGLWQTSARHELDDAGTDALAAFMAQEVFPHLTHAEISEIRIENPASVDKPFVAKCRVRVPHFAEFTGSRLFLQPIAFQKNAPSVFPETRRRHPVLFPYARAEDDLFTITLPADYEIEAGSSPGGLNFEKHGQYLAIITLAQKKRLLSVRRAFIRNAIAAETKEYPAIKAMYDEVHTRDSHVLTFKRTDLAD